MSGRVGRLVLAGLITLAAGATSAQDSPGPTAGMGAAPRAVTGEQVFTQVCRACHMSDAKGATGAATIPALANNPHLEVAAYPIIMVLFGRGAMPALGRSRTPAQSLTPAQIANVVNYVRTHFGNHYAARVTEADVKLIAAQYAAK